MTTAAQRRAYEIERRVDDLVDVLGLDDPWRVHFSDDLHTMAERSYDAEQQGQVQAYTWLVIPFHGESGWGYTAVKPDGVMHGCTHTVLSADRRLSQADAVVAHRQGRCEGKVERDG